MNIEQIKQDLESGVMVSRSTVVALVEAALLMEVALSDIAYSVGIPRSCDGQIAANVLAEVEEL